VVSGIAATEAGIAAIQGGIEAGLAQAKVQALPSFFVLGPPRTGSTWIYDVLQARALLPSPTKETRFFDIHFDRGIDWYLDHFPGNPEKRVVGEVAPTYFASPQACARIRALRPHARLIVVFRNPVQRLISLYRLKRAYGFHAWSLEEALDRDPELITSSQYATHLKMWRSYFAPEQISISFFEDLTGNPQGFIDHICRFAGLPLFSLKQSEMRAVFSSGSMTEPRLYAATRAAQAVADWCRARKLDSVVHRVRNSRAFNLLVGGGAPLPSLPGESLARIQAILQPETEELESMLGRDLSAWKIPKAA
jgi:LPS sulfotransferase NodH